jgi:hypothetical protein
MKTKYSLNQSTFDFVLEFEKAVESGNQFNTDELVQKFELSRYYDEIIKTYSKPPNNSIWYALLRSGQWEQLKRGLYRKK